MQTLFEELDYWPTPIGAVSLRRRWEPNFRREVYEIKLGDEFLMSSLFTVSEEALATLGLDALEGDRLDVAVGGLGLGYTARAALDHARVASVTVVEMLEPVIEWHRSGLLPLGKGWSRSALAHRAGRLLRPGRVGQRPGPAAPGRRFDAVLLDIDHSPDALLDARSTSFYRPDGLRALARHLKPGGIFGL